jgi:hypothetical protein
LILSPSAALALAFLSTLLGLTAPAAPTRGELCVAEVDRGCEIVRAAQGGLGEGWWMAAVDGGGCGESIGTKYDMVCGIIGRDMDFLYFFLVFFCFFIYEMTA